MKLIRQDQRFFINFFHLGVILCFIPIFMSSTHTDKKNICFSMDMSPLLQRGGSGVDLFVVRFFLLFSS